MTSPVIGAPSVGQGPGGRPRLGDLRSHLTCVLCAGYFIDATTIVECLHTFCRSCILRHLEASSYCPICDVMIHRTKGSSSLRADRILQTIVYKLVPGLFSQEMKMRREFYEMKPYADPELPDWAKGDVSSYVPHVFTPDEHLQLRLAPFDTERCDEDAVERHGTACGPETVPPVRYLRCQAGTPLSVLHKFISAKFQLPPSVQVQLIYGQRVLPDDISLMDLGYLYRPAQDAPVRLEYRLVRKRPVASITPATSAAASQPAAVKLEPDTVTSSPASPPATSISETASMMSETVAVTSEPIVETSEPPAKRRRTGGESRQPVVLLERLFDADDEEPTSPKEVDDLIASLDAEEETPQQKSIASPSPGPGTTKEEDVAQSSTALPDPSAESDVVDTSTDCVEDRPAETDCDDQCGTGSGLNHVPSPDVCAGGGDEGLASGEARVEQEVSVGESARSDIVEVRADVCGEMTTVSRDKSGYTEGAVTPAPAEASPEQSASDTTTATHVSTTSGTGAAEPTSEKFADDAPKADSKLGEADSELACNDDTVSECGLVVDEEASVATPEAMETLDDTPTAGSLQPSPEVVRQESSVTLGRPDEPAESVGASIEAPPDPPSESTSPGAETDSKGKSVTTERGSSCATGTQTSLCSVSKRSETLVSSASSSVTTGSSTEKFQTASITDSSVLIKSSEAKSGSPCTSSVSCGTQDIEELSRKSPTKVDCSVQTVPAETVRRPHKKPAKCVPSDAGMEAGKGTFLQRSQLGTMHPQRDTHLSNGLKTVSTNAVKSLKGSLSKVTHPELASRLVQSVENIGDSRRAASFDTPKAYAANILKIPNAPSSKTPPQGLESKKVGEVAAKDAAVRDAKHSPDSSSMSYAKLSTDMKHFFKEVPRSSSGVAKYLEKNHRRALTGSPLDLSTRANKSAADSTSMVPKRPVSKLQTRKLKPAKAQGTQTIHSIVRNLSRSQHISLTPIPSDTSKNAKSVQSPKQRQRQPVPHEIQPASFPFSPGMSPHDFYSSPLHVNTSIAGRLNYDLAMRNLLTLSHMAMAQGGMVRPPHMFPMQPMFPPRPQSHEFPAIPDPSLLRQPSEARMGAASKKASPTAGTTAPQLRTPTGLTSASIQHMEDLTRTVGKRTDKERHSVTVTPIPPK